MRFKKAVFLILFLFLFIQFIWAQEIEIMPVKDIRPGMKGYGLSVFKGTEITKFPITVLGITHNITRTLDTIIIRIDGGYCVEHKISIIAGMSGSPVYINGKLIGAIAYGWGFAKEPIGGVRPIEEMLKVLGKDKRISETFSNELQKPVNIKGKEFNKIKISNEVDEPASPDTLVLSPIKSLFLVSGLDSENLEKLNSRFKGRAVFQNSLTGGYYYLKTEIKVEPGSAIGIPFIKGDVTACAIGTVTYRKGNQILAFGHDVFNLGKTNLPLSTAYIHNILPSYIHSFKMGSLVKDVGTLYEDRIPAIAGKLGPIPPMIPAAIEISNQKDNFRKKYNIEVVDLGADTAVFLEVAVSEALSLSGSPAGPHTAIIDYEVLFEDNRSIKLENAFFDPEDVRGSVAGEFGKTLVDLLDNRFAPLKIKNVKVKLKIEPVQKTAKIQKVYLSKNKAKPGETIQVHILFKPYKGAVKEKIIPVKLPADLKKGVIQIGVCGGVDFIALRRKLELYLPRATNIDQFLRNLKEKERNNQIILKVVLPQDGLDISGEKFNRLIPSRLQILDSGAESDIRLEKDIATRILETPYVVTGLGITSVKIQDYESTIEKEKSEEKTTEASVSSNLVCKESNILFLAADQIDNNKEEKEISPESESKESNKKKITSEINKEKSEEPKPRPEVFPFTESKWTQSGYSQFEKGTAFNTAISDLGYITLAPKKETLFSSKNIFLWAVAFDKKNKSIITTDSSGRIWRIASGKKEILTTLPGVIVNSLAVDEFGFIWAATSPQGKLYKITSTGQKKVFKLKALHLWKVLVDSSNQIFVSTGAPGKVYKINQADKISLFYSSPETHIKSMVFDKSGRLVIGTGNNGLVYKVQMSGTAKAVFQIKDSTIEDMVYDSYGNLYIAAGSRLVKLTPQGKFYTYGFSEKFVTALAINSKDEILIGTSLDGKLYKLTSDEQTILLYDLNTDAVLAFSKDGQDNFYFTTGNKAYLFKLSSRLSVKGSFESEVFDTGNLSRFGIIRWSGQVPAGSRLTLQTRSGNNLIPDKSWSSWSREYTAASGDSIKTPPGRFVQYRVDFTLRQVLSGQAQYFTSSSGKAPTLAGVEVFYKNFDKPPYMYFAHPDVFESWSGEQEIEWAAGDANLDTLGFALFHSKEFESKWHLIADDIPVILKKKEIKEDKNPATHKQTYLWDTTKVSDGSYQLKLLAYNRLYSENKKLQTVIISEPLIICNTKPVIEILSKKTEKEKFTLKGVIKSKLVFPSQVKYSFDKEEWKLALPLDNMYGGFQKEFLIRDRLPEKFKGTLFIQGKDEAGNIAKIEEKI